jgi:ribosomal protein S1
LVHKSEIEKNPDEPVEELFKVGAELTSRVININAAERKLDLSMKTMFG